LDGQYTQEDATELVGLASKCLQYEAKDRPDVKFLLSAVAPLQKQKEVASHVLMGLAKTPVALPTVLSPLGKACARMDLTAVHDILLKTGYRDEEGAENELLFLKLSFQEWTQQVQDMLNTKKFGDISFRDKDFKNAIEYYSKLVSMMSVPSVTVVCCEASPCVPDDWRTRACPERCHASSGVLARVVHCLLHASSCPLKAWNGN